MNAYALRKGSSSTQPDWLAVAAPYLDKVELMIEATVASDVPTAYELSMHLFSAGGKRIRPTLAILCALAVDASSDVDRISSFSTAAELVHMASLVHDDVVDETFERRGTSTANAEWGNKISVLGGDYLLSKAFALLSRDGDVEVIRALSNTAVKMTEGELLQAASEGDLCAWETNYWDIVKGKTAAFMGACCECGAVIAKADSPTRAALAEYGLQVGLAFQITDDLLDIAGDRTLTGKEIGTDLMHGKFTLPVIFALEQFDAEERRLLLESSKAGIGRDQARELAARVASSGAPGRARQVAVECTQRAVAQLEGLRDSEFKSALEALATSVVSRSV